MKMSEESFSINCTEFHESMKEKFSKFTQRLDYFTANIHRTCQFPFPELVELHLKITQVCILMYFKGRTLRVHRRRAPWNCWRQHIGVAEFKKMEISWTEAVKTASPEQSLKRSIIDGPCSIWGQGPNKQQSSVKHHQKTPVSDHL